MKLHLGCGSNAMPGWENLDLEPVAGAIQWKAPMLPYPDDSVDFIYSEHFIEHIEYEECKILFKDAHRVLKTGGVMRVSTPFIRTIFEDWNDDNMEKYSRGGINFESRTHFVNQAFRDWGHKFIYDIQCLELLWFGTGVSRRMYHNSIYPELCKLECRPDFEDLIMEFNK